MPSRAFVPVPLIDAQPRVYKSFRGRQLKGLLCAVGGAAISIMLVGISDFHGYLLTFFAALPGFAYGYYRPQGQPVEYWLRVLIRYYRSPQILTASREASRSPSALGAQIKPVVLAGLYLLRLALARRRGTVRPAESLHVERPLRSRRRCQRRVR